MKKNRLSNSCVYLIALLLFVFSISCQKKGTVTSPNNQMIPIVSPQKANNQFHIQHARKKCIFAPEISILKITKQ